MLTITAQDGTTDSVHPIQIGGWSPSADSANIVHDLIDGTIAITLVGDRLRSGDLELYFDTDATAEEARALLGRPTSFTLTDDDRPVVNIAFVRQGRLGTMIHDRADDVWAFSVGFQEVIP